MGAYLGDEIYKTPGSSITYRVGIMPPGDGDYSLAGFFEENTGDRNLEREKRWGELLSKLGVKRALAPQTNFTRNIAWPGHLKSRKMLPSGIPVHYDQTIEADAVVLAEPGDAMIIANGGCSAIAMVCRDRMVAGHGGLNSLIDRSYVLDANRENNGSIVDAMTSMVCASQSERLREGSSCRAFASIPRNSYDFPDEHEVHESFNARLYELLVSWYDAERSDIVTRGQRRYFLDQGQLIGAQARQRGFRVVSTCLHPLKNKAFATTRHTDVTMRSKRNGIVIVRVT